MPLLCGLLSCNLEFKCDVENPEDLKAVQNVKDRWHDMQNNVVSTLARVLEHYQGSFKDIECIFNPLVYRLAALYVHEDEQEMPMSFFFGTGLDKILECMTCVVDILEEHGSQAILALKDDVLLRVACQRFGQKSNYLIVQNIRETQSNIYYYEELIKLSQLINLLASYDEVREKLKTFKVWSIVEKAMSTLLYVNPNAARDQVLTNTLGIIGCMV